MNYKDLGIAAVLPKSALKLNLGRDEAGSPHIVELEVKQYLPIQEKANLIQYVAQSALDLQTGTFSPIRVELFFTLAVCKFYAGIEIDDSEDVTSVYDAIDTNKIADLIMSAIPDDEINFMRSLVNETLQDMARFNTSAAGIISNMNTDAGNLDSQINDIFEKIKNKEGIETLMDIKNTIEGKTSVKGV